MRYRLGRSHQDIVYRQLGDEPSDEDPRVAVFTDAIEAIRVVQLLNDFERVSAIQTGPARLADGSGVAIPAPTGCCGDPKNLDGNAHPWEHVSEDGPGDVYRCPECGAVDID